MRVLLVDDEPFSVQGIVDSVNWEKLGIEEVVVAYSMKSALDQLCKKKIDIAICDIEMPNGTGIDLVRQIRDDRKEKILCIFLTAHSDFDFAQQAIKLGCFDYILKPARPEVIEKMLIRAIEKLHQDRKDEKFVDYGQLYVRNIIGKSEEDDANSEDVVEKCVDYIREHIQDTLSVEELAAQYYLNPDYLSRLFRKKYGMSLSSYIKEQRMFLARELLEHTDISITMVSAKSGYDNYSAFISSFKKFYGMSPREFRKQSGRIIE